MTSSGINILERLSYVSYNKAEGLKPQTKAYLWRFSYEYKVIYVKQIYPTRAHVTFESAMEFFWVVRALVSQE